MSTHTIDELVEKLSNLTVMQMAELKNTLEAKWGVKAQASGHAVMMAAPAAAAAAVEESTDFTVTLDAVPADKKIAAIKLIREITGLGLKEAKELVEAAPKVIKESAPKAEANDIKKKADDIGVKVILKGI